MNTRSFLSALTLAISCLAATGSGLYAQRSLQHEVVVDASAQEVWQAFTVPEKMVSWMSVTAAKVDLRVGGDMMTTYSRTEKLGGPSTIINEILSFEEGKMLSIRNKKAPEGTGFDKFKGTWTVLYFDAMTPKRTRVRITGMGFGEGEEWDSIYNFFNQGNEWTLQQLKKYYAGSKEQLSHEETWNLLAGLVGGQWISKNEMPDGKSFYVYNKIRKGAHPDYLTAKGYLGTKESLHFHGDTMIWKNLGNQRIHFQNINENGDLAAGTIYGDAATTLIWDWRVHHASGAKSDFKVLFTFKGKDQYQFELIALGEQGQETQLQSVTFSRVMELGGNFPEIPE